VARFSGTNRRGRGTTAWIAEVRRVRGVQRFGSDLELSVPQLEVAHEAEIQIHSTYAPLDAR
jgi:hypothetical protein